MSIEFLEQIEEARLKGYRQGKHETKIIIANRLLNKGMDIDSIMSITQLDREEIEKLTNFERKIEYNDVLIALEEGLEEAKKMSIGFLRYEEEQKEMARREGQLEERLKIAKAFLKMADDETIAKNTGLSIEEVKALRKEKI